MKKRRAWLIVGFFVSILASSSLGRGAEKLRFATAFKGPQFDLPALAAEEKGFWKQNGLEVQWFSMEGGSPTFQAMVAGSVDMGVATPTSHIQAAARGIPTIVVADLGFVEDWSIWVRPEGPIKEPKDLKGGKVGTSRFGGQAYANAIILLKGMGIEKEVRLVAVGGLSARLAALRAGIIDGFAVGSTAAAPLKVQGFVRGLGSLKDILPKEWSDLTVSAHKDFLARRPELVKRSIKAFVEATDYVKKDQEWTLEKLKTFSRYSEAAAKEIYSILFYSKDGRIDKKMIENVRAFLIEYDIIAKEKAPLVEFLYTNQFVS